MTDYSADEATLAGHGVRPTAMRLLVLRTLRAAECAVSLADMERSLDTADRSTLFRTLTLFLEHHIVHQVTDHTGRVMYALCPPGCLCDVPGGAHTGDHHAHFTCEACGKTFCLRHQPVPEVKLPDGFTVTAANYTLRGLCPACSRK